MQSMHERRPRIRAFRPGWLTVRKRANKGVRDECHARWRRRVTSDPATTMSPLAPRNFIAADEPMPPPARPQQPCLGSGNRGAIGGKYRALGPSLEPSARGRWVDRERGHPGRWGSLARMLSCVEEDVGKGRSHLPGRTQRAVVIAAVENRSPPIEDAIHGPGEARGQALHTIPQGHGAFRFNEQVDVIVLQRVVDDPEVSTFRDRAKRVLYLANQAHCSQRRHVAANADRHQPRVAFRKFRTPAMPYSRPHRSLSPGTLPRSTPAHGHLQVQLELRSTRHTLDCGHVLAECQDETLRVNRKA